MHVLVVDDSKSMRKLLRRILILIGCEVSEANDGQGALDQLIQGAQVDLMVVDWKMPVMNGFDLVRAVRADARLNGIRIMMITSETSLDSVEQALAAGADEYLMKPFTPEIVQKKLALLGINVGTYSLRGA